MADETTDITALFGGGIELKQNPTDAQFPAEQTIIKGFAIEFELNEAEKIVQETTTVKGFAIELIDYPIFAFTIHTRRL